MRLRSGSTPNSALALALLIAALGLACPDVQAQEHRSRERAAEFRSPHWHFDDRYRHGHYYPAFGYSVPVLPAGIVAIGFGGSSFFFHAGVFYRPAGPAYVVVRPPMGIVVPVLPPAYATVWSTGAPYYYANDTYFTAVPGGAGYAVVAPPPGAEPTTAPPATPSAVYSLPAGQAPNSATQPSAGTGYYCEASKAYYPYVQECQEGWRPVPATPAAAR